MCSGGSRALVTSLLCLLSGLAAAGCGSSDPGSPNPRGDRDAEPRLARELLRPGGLSGVVVDVRGNRLADARIAYGALATETNARGGFELGDVEAGSSGVLVVTRDGFSTGRVPLSVIESASNYIRVTLQAAERARLADPSADSEVTTDSGVMMKLKAGSLVDEEGDPVTSPVDIVVALINDRDEMAAAPGGMFALDPDARDDSRVRLESFGMVEVQLSADGRPVRLNGRDDAELRIPMAQNHPFNPDDTVALWHFDEDDEVWKRIGEGMVDAENKFRAQVTHFSWWNADQVLTETCVVGRVLDASGAGIAADIHGEGRSYLGSSHTSSVANGSFCLEARMSSVIELSTLVRVGGEEQALAVRVNTPSWAASCGQPSSCFVLPEPLVAVANQPLCDPAACPADPEGIMEACCLTDLGPCAFVVNGDCGGSADGSWDAPPDSPGVVPIPGVPMSVPPSSSDAGITPPIMDASTVPLDGMVVPPDAGGGTTDAGTPPIDAGTPPIDAGTPPIDAGTPPIDAGMQSDGGTPTDAGTAGSGGAGGAGGGGAGGTGGTGGTGGGGPGGTGGATDGAVSA